MARVIDIDRELDRLRVAVSEVEALANVILESFKRADWCGADGLVVRRTRHVLGVLATSATSVTSKLERVQTALVGMPQAPPSELRDNGKGMVSREQTVMTESQHAAMIYRRDAAIVRRFRERCAIAFDLPVTYPFFRESYLGGEEANTALLRIFKRHREAGVPGNDEDVISAIIEHGRWRI
jgi:hypothetical protein